MSRKGKLPVSIPKGVEVAIKDNLITVKGSKGTLEQSLIEEVLVTKDESSVKVDIEKPENSKFQGLYRTLIANMVEGVQTPFKKVLQLVGVGYRSAVKGNKLSLQVGHSHPVELEIPSVLSVAVKNNTEITIEGPNKQLVGQFAANVRSKRPPEPYKGTGIRYADERVRRKAGKTSKK